MKICIKQAVQSYIVAIRSAVTITTANVHMCKHKLTYVQYIEAGDGLLQCDNKASFG